MGRKPTAGPENSFRPLCAIGFALSLHEIRIRYPAALLGHVSLRDCSSSSERRIPWEASATRTALSTRFRCCECPLIIRALRPGKYPEHVARVMIARVVRLPAFRSGLKSELAQRFCCRCPACDPSTRRLPRVAVQPSSRCRRFVTSISCHPGAFRQRRCSTSSSSCFCCGRAALPACAVPWLLRHVLLHLRRSRDRAVA